MSLLLVLSLAAANPPPFQTIEDFDDGQVVLVSYPGEDMHPDSWVLDSVRTHDSTPYSLKLFGNTWKLEYIDPIELDSGDVWQVAAYVEERGEIQGFGLVDSNHALLYAFAGTQLLNPEVWVTVFQGAFPEHTWNLYRLPVADDWKARYGYLPAVHGIVFINDRDSDPTAVCWFDQVLDITEDLPIRPRVQAWWHRESTTQNPDRSWDVTISFHSRVTDPDSPEHEYLWHFGDDSTSTDSAPVHTYTVLDDHEYTVLLEVMDSTRLWARTTCRVEVDPGPTTFPVTMNFVGDIMLARRYELPGGIIDTLGVEGIFEPTLAWLGDAADITVANLESPLTNRGTRHPTKSVVFRGSPDNVAGLSYAGIDLVSLANNHITDYGSEGMTQTQDTLRAEDILFSGAGMDLYEASQPVYVQESGVNLGFLGCCDRTGQYNNWQPFLDAGYNKPGFAGMDTYRLFRSLLDMDTVADLSVVEIHAGSEYVPEPEDQGDEFYSRFDRFPTDDNVAIRRRLIDNSADLVVCHHPHMLQGFEVHDGKLVAHSLGDFAFDLDYPETYPSVILHAEIDETGFCGYTLTPVYIDDYIPRRAEGELGLYVLDELARRSRDLGSVVVVDRDSVIAEVVLDTTTLNPQPVLQVDGLELEEHGSWWVSAPVRLKHDGCISAITNISPEQDWEFRLGRELIWFGNCEDEGSTMWQLDHEDEFYDTVANRGLRSLCQKRAEGQGPLNTGLEERMVCWSDSTGYSLHAAVETQNAAEAGVSVRMFRYRTGGSPLGTAALDTVPPVSAWTLYSTDFVPENGTGFFDIRLRSTGPDSGRGRAWFDDVGIIEWEQWQEFEAPAKVVEPYDYHWVQVRTGVETETGAIEYQETAYGPPVATKAGPLARAIRDLHVAPNPAQRPSVITYQLAGTARVKLTVYNVLGQRVKSLVDGNRSPGLQSVVWDHTDDSGRSVSPGTYFCRLSAGSTERTLKLVLTR